MKINCVNKSVFVAESARADFDRLDLAVDAFCRGITDLQKDGIYDAPPSNGFRSFFNGFKPAQLSQRFRPLSAKI